MSDAFARPIAAVPTATPALAKLSITAIILTGNEERHIERCLSRILPFVERVVVVDSFSSDATVAIATRMGAEVVCHAFKHQAAQMQWALDTLTITTAWVLKLDCDEYFESSALQDLADRLSDLPGDVTGLQFVRKYIFMDKWIRYGRYYPTYHVRLWRSGVGQMEQRWMDEHVVLAQGRVETIRGGDLVDHNLGDLTDWIAKHNRYATRHMIDFVNREYGLFTEDERLHDTASIARRNRFLKNSFYGRVPIYLRATLFYLYRYVVRLGFLDGKVGYIFHFLHGFWLMMLIDAKIDEARRFIRAHGIESFREYLKTRHGIELEDRSS